MAADKRWIGFQVDLTKSKASPNWYLEVASRVAEPLKT